MKGGKMWIKRSTYEKLQDEYDKLQISNLLLGKRLILSERKLKETEVKNGLEIVPELKRQISELKDQNKVMREMLKEAEEKADDDCKWDLVQWLAHVPLEHTTRVRLS